MGAIHRRHVLAVLLVTGALAGWSSRRLAIALPWRFPPLTDLSVTDHYLTDLGAIMLGSHRLAGDLAYIQFLQYYGVPEGEEEEEEGKFHDFAAGVYPRLRELATRYLRLDPYFTTPVLEAAGALAFNQKRVDESLALLREAITRNPEFFRYHLYVSAILYKQQGKDEAMVGLLEEGMKYSDCPTA